jgi:hypothetical protein
MQRQSRLLRPTFPQMCIADKKHIRLRQNRRLLQQLCD